MRLNFLSRQPEVVLDSPYFEQRTSVFEDLEESKGQGIDQMDNGIRSSITGLQDVASPSTQSSSLKHEQQDSGGMVVENRSIEAPSPSSGTKTNLGSVFCTLIYDVYYLFFFLFNWFLKISSCLL